MSRCAAKTKKGDRCNGGAMRGHQYCGPHADHSVVEHNEVVATVRLENREIPAIWYKSRTY